MQNFTLTLFTNQPELAARADAAGVDRVGLDLETLGKSERQGHLNTWISDHQEADLPRVRTFLHKAKLFARCNPPNADLNSEVDRLIAQGVNALMLPYFETVAQAQSFVDAVGGRARTVLLIETARAAEQTKHLCNIPGVDEIHFGLNDLRLSLGWATHFHVLVSDDLVRWCEIVNESGLPCAVGGVGRAHDNSLPIPSDLVLAQLARLRASGSLISRAFFKSWDHDLGTEITLLRQALSDCFQMSSVELSQQRLQLVQLIDR